MVRSYANVIIPLVLAFAIGVLVYLYGTSTSQFHSAEEELKEIKKDLADARGEKESLRYELDTLTDELEQLSKDKKEALQRAEAAEENAHKANNDMDKLQASLDAVQEELRSAKENANELQGNRDKVKGDLTTYISKWKQCEAAKKDLNTQMRQKGQEHESAVKSLREEMDTLTSGKIDTERKLNEMEQAFRVCENLRSSIGGSSQQQQQGQQQAPAVDERSMELLPPVGGAKKSPADGSLSRGQGGVARQPGAAVGERENGGEGVMSNNKELPQRQLNFEQVQGQQKLRNNNNNNNNIDINQDSV